MPARPGTERGGIGSLFSTKSPSLRPSPTAARPHARTNDRIRIRPSRPYTPGRPTAQTPPRPTHSLESPSPPTPGNEHRKRRKWEPCSVLPTTLEGECRLGRAQKEEEQLCSGSTSFFIYYTIPHKEETKNTNTPPGGVWSCLALYSIFCLLSGFGWIDLHGTLFH